MSFQLYILYIPLSFKLFRMACLCRSYDKESYEGG